MMIGFIISLLLGCWLVGKLPFFVNSKLKPLSLRIFFIVKVGAGGLLLFIYSHYYPKSSSDMYNYYKDGNIMHSALKENPLDFFSMLSGIGSERAHLSEYYNKMSSWNKPWISNYYNDNKTVIRLNAAIRSFSGDNILVHLVVFNFISFIGLICFFRLISEFVSRRKKILIAFITFLTPSVLIWGSGIMKETVLIFSLGTTLWIIYYTLFKSFKWYYLLFLFITFPLLFITKVYVFLALVPALVWLCFYRFYPQKKWLSFLIIHFLIALFAFNFYLINEKFDLAQMISRKQGDFYNVITYLSKSGSAVEINYLDGTFWSILKTVPQGLYHTFCRPHIFDSHNLLSLIAALENTFINIVLILSILFTRIRNFKPVIVMFSISLVLLLFSIIGITTPVLGALTRYKIPGLLFLLSVIIIIFDAEKFKIFLSKFKIKKIISKFDVFLTKITDLMFINVSPIK